MVLIKQTRFAIWPYYRARLMNRLAHKRAHTCTLLTRLSSIQTVKSVRKNKKNVVIDVVPALRRWKMLQCLVVVNEEYESWQEIICFHTTEHVCFCLSCMVVLRVHSSASFLWALRVCQ